MDAIPFSGTAKTKPGADRSGTTALTAGIKSHRHFWASVNYIHHNPVKHGYINKWQDWPWSSAAEFLDRVGRSAAEKIWRQFPILDYGKGWDVD
jgi:putative transposase